MASFSAPQPGNPELPTFFNVDGVVGAAPATNSREDVLLVQFYFTVIANDPPSSATPQELAVLRAVQANGVVDSATIEAIRITQERMRQASGPGVIIDGRVSPVRSGYNYGAGKAWTIVNLNESIQERNMRVWPRIDQISGCPAEIAQMVQRTVIGV
jgi:hypothetical protein